MADDGDLILGSLKVGNFLICFWKKVMVIVNVLVDKMKMMSGGGGFW